jgi:glycosyltransferase involved in cell wall biosynthesis/SAM-dependent methyltransferase
MMPKPVIVIPAYVPANTLPALVSQLTTFGHNVVIVDDGSGTESAGVFELLSGPRISLLRHAVNLGKGAALRTGINHALAQFPDCIGIVTADADGQHLASDILAISHALTTEPDRLILGVRSFNGAVPFRSRAGNLFTRKLVQIVVGRHLQDTQTGLRGIPASLARDLLHLTSQGYEFELDMLILAKHLAVPVREIPIATVYLNGNASSHFHPLRDSMKIGFVLFRFGLLSALTSVLDNAVFALAFAFGGKVAAAQIAGRCVAMAFNYVSARRAVFLSRDSHAQALPRYILLVLANGFVSYALLTFLNHKLGTGVVTSKIIAELCLFCASFALQRDFVFTRRRPNTPSATDWDSYYRSAFPAARWTRRYTARALESALLKFGLTNAPLSIIEFGGANSCFVQGITQSVPTQHYYAADLNRFGLDMLTQRKDLPESVRAVHADVLKPDTALPTADVVMSIGLIEHFTPGGTEAAIENHFRHCKPGGLVILSYPTPTLLYRAARRLAEFFRAWRFPDERPLAAHEVHDTAARHGELLDDRILWPLVFTQRMMAFRKGTRGTIHA